MRRQFLRLAAAMLAFALVSSPAAVTGDSTRVRRVGVSIKEERILVSFSYRDAFSRKVKEKLSSGLTTRVVVQLSLERKGDRRPLSFFARTVELTYDLWEDEFIVIRDDPSGRRRADAENQERAIDFAGIMSRVPIADATGLSDGEYRIRAQIETNPVSREMLEKIRQWLMRSRATKAGSAAPSNYFGSFVGALVDRKISQADHRIDFVSQWFILGER